MIEKSLAELIVGSSAVIRRLRETIARVGPSRLAVLILGPTGAGKELVAQGVHLASRRSGRFVPCNVCALSPSLFESEVFGHVRGAFTSAVRDRRGHLADANGGTMFFDEIGGLSLESQPKLLRALDGYAFRPVGAPQDRTSDFRLVTATNDNLRAMVMAGTFRIDLWHRIAGVTVNVPPLSAHIEDLPELCEHFLTRQRGEQYQRRSISDSALAVLRVHPWRGNVRELALTLERAALFADGSVIDATHVEAAIDPAGAAAPAHALQKVAHEKLIAALTETDGDTLKAAQRLGISRATVYRYLQSIGLTARRWRSGAATLLSGHDLLSNRGVPNSEGGVSDTHISADGRPGTTM